MPISSFWKHPLQFSLLLVVVLSILSGVLAFQVPVNDNVAIGWLGDQLFLDYSAGLGQDAVDQGAWYADDLTPDSPTGRSRWSRQHATITLPNIGRGVGMNIHIIAQGFPPDVIATAIESLDSIEQPIVTVRADGVIIGSFTPTEEWAEYTFFLSPHVHTGADLLIELETSATFTHTERGEDARPKGVRLAGLRIQSHVNDAAWIEQSSFNQQFESMRQQVLPPVWRAVGLLTLVVVLVYILLLRLLGSHPITFLLTALSGGLLGIGLALTRIWMGAILYTALWVLAGALLLAWYQPLLRIARLLVRRYAWGRGINYGLVTATLAGTGYAIARTITHLERYLTAGSTLFASMFPDSLLVTLLMVSFLALTLIPGYNALPRFVRSLVDALNHPRTGFIVLLIAGSIWIGYESIIIAKLPYVGHADYADNAVVARNLLNGRGWVVDYVTQFYHLYTDTTRPQETWPLLQPVWIAPFLALFGMHAWAAKIPNVLCNIALLLLIYHIGTRLWDRRIGFVAAFITLTSHLFFKLTIYTTSDLAFVVFVTAALFLLYQAKGSYHGDTETRREYKNSGETLHATSLRKNLQLSLQKHRHIKPLLFSGVFTGLMMLQKPSGAVIATGMGIWLLLTLSQYIVAGNGNKKQRLSLPHIKYIATTFLLWAVPALVILSPYLIRNMILFQKPVYSTESYDAWVLGYRGDSGEAWNDIYRVYIPELGGAGIPDRSWILRWGFDLTLDKMKTQVEATRDYLLPAWKIAKHAEEHTAQTTSPTWRTLLSQNERKNLLSPLGAWLSCAGIIVALGSRRRLLALLFLAFVPYALFLITYWHANEERYFLMLIPWLSLFAAWIIWGTFDRLQAIGKEEWSVPAFLLVAIAVWSILHFSWAPIASKVQHEPDKWAPDIAAYEWLHDHTEPDAVVMTRNPWQLNWHAQRHAVMIPNTNNYDILMFLARHYQVQYIVFDSLQRVKGDAAALLDPLVNAQDVQEGDRVDGFTLVYASPTVDNRVLIYKLPNDLNGSLE